MVPVLWRLDLRSWISLMGQVLREEVNSRADYINTGEAGEFSNSWSSPLGFHVYSNTRRRLSLRNPREQFCDSRDCTNSYRVIRFCAWEKISHVEIFNNPRKQMHIKISSINSLKPIQAHAHLAAHLLSHSVLQQPEWALPSPYPPMPSGHSPALCLPMVSHDPSHALQWCATIPCLIPAVIPHCPQYKPKCLIMASWVLPNFTVYLPYWFPNLIVYLSRMFLPQIVTGLPPSQHSRLIFNDTSPERTSWPL